MIAVIGLIAGILLGLALDIRVPDAYTIYFGVAILACFDSVLGAFKAFLTASFNQIMFLSGFFGNALIAVVLTYFGNQLSIPMYLAAVIVFGSRIFNNFALIRRSLMERYYQRIEHEK